MIPRILGSCLFLAIVLHERPLLAQSVDPKMYLSNLTKLMDRPWPKNRTINIVVHGHSVPAGYFKTPEVDTFHAYPHLLHKALKDRYPHAVINVIVTAIGGENSLSGAKRFAAEVLCHRPDLITIDYALNDRAVGLEKARAAWVDMLKQAQACNIPVLLLTPTADLKAKLDDPNDPLNQHAEQIRQLAQEYRVGLVDSLAVFKAAVKSGTKLGDLMAQFNHPNATGHRLVADELLKWFP
jgi:acyl-CoA thioesterase-1